MYQPFSAALMTSWSCLRFGGHTRTIIAPKWHTHTELHPCGYAVRANAGRSVQTYQVPSHRVWVCSGEP